jgi:hypothetical protein
MHIEIKKYSACKKILVQTKRVTAINVVKSRLATFCTKTLISDFTDPELHEIREMLTHRYEKDVEIHLADCDLPLEPESENTVSCPTVFWHESGANFVIYKIGMYRFRTQFFYTPHEQYSTNTEEYYELDECVSAVLNAEDKHDRDNAVSTAVDN